MKAFETTLALLAQRYPETASSIDIRQRLTETLLCPSSIQLPKHLCQEAQAIVEAFAALREVKERKAQLEAREPKILDPGNHSVLMSYDFHIDEAGRLRLIEINTNASLALLVDLLYRQHEVSNPFSADSCKDIVDSFEAEFRLAFPAGERQLRTIAIVDEVPEIQKLYIEFLFYKELFAKRGYRVLIVDPKELEFADGALRYQNTQIDLVYNRHTDFYLETPETKALKSAMDARAACITPHPHEYRLLADKGRLLELSHPNAIENLPLPTQVKEAIAKTLIRTHDIGEFKDHDALWAQRKKWFFKPAQSYGGKAVYRGSSVTRPVFAEIVKGKYLAQEFVPAPVIKLQTQAAGEQEFKFDLRFYVYRDKIQLAAARLYQGQVTNMRTLGGGVAPIRWI